MAVILAYRVRAHGMRGVLGLDVGLSADVVFWRAFLRDLMARGVRGIRLVTSDAHAGLKQAIAEVLVGVGWATVQGPLYAESAWPGAPQGAVDGGGHRALDLRVARPGSDRRPPAAGVRSPRGPLPSGGAAARGGRKEILIFFDFPAEHRRQVAGTDHSERLNKELERRSAVVEIFPTRHAVLCLFSALLAEENAEWLVERRYVSDGVLRKLLQPDGETAPSAAETEASREAETNAPERHGGTLHHLTGHYRAGSAA